MTKPDLFDTVELLTDLPQHDLRAGTYGAIVHQYDNEVYEVEFANDAGETVALCPLSIREFVVVWHHATQSWAPIEEQVAALVKSLGEPEGREALDFVRFLHWRARQDGRKFNLEPAMAM